MRSLKVHNFDLKDTLECGQTFCWVKEDDGYVNADVGQAIYVEQDGDMNPVNQIVSYWYPNKYKQ